MDDSDRLVKIYIALPDDGTVGGESLWALPLGDDLYEVRNIPFFTYDLHFLDVVRAIPPDHDMKPEVMEVVRRSGHKTLRVLFAEEMPDEDIAQILSELNRAHAHYEKATSHFYAFDVEPDADYPAICTYLFEREQAGLLEYETGMTKQDDMIH
jgi:Domain of unknown function (DUF4265)